MKIDNSELTSSLRDLYLQAFLVQIAKNMQSP